MKKIIGSVIAVAVLTTLAFAGENYFHTIKAEFGAFASKLAVGMSEASAPYALDVNGASRFVGAQTISGARSITGTDSHVGSIAVSTSASSSSALTFRGCVVTLSTRSASYGDVLLQKSDNKIYLATQTITENMTTCSGTACYSALN